MTDVPTGTVADNGAFEGHSPAPAPSQQQEGHYRQQQQHPAQNPRAEGYSPAQQARQQQPSAPGERKVSIAGKEYAEQSVADILADHAQREIVKAGLPGSPDKYEIKLPEGFKPPEGMAFEFKADDPALIEARKAAHELKLDQAGFSRMLGIYAANKLAENQAVTAGRQAEMDKLGATGPQRLEAVETWLKAKVGDKASTIISTLKQYPVAANVETFEALMRAFSSQGGAGVTQTGREGQEDAGKIAGYENMNFVQRRTAQMNQKLAGGGR